MLQVAKDNAEPERRPLRSSDSPEEKMTYDALYLNSELGSLRDDDSVRSNILSRAMSGSSETSQREESRTRARVPAQVHQPITRGTQGKAMPPLLEAIGE